VPLAALLLEKCPTVILIPGFSGTSRVIVSKVKVDPESGKSKQAVAQTGNPFERSLKCFLLTNLGEAEEKRCQLFEP